MNNPILFIGDSLTQWGNWNELFPQSDIENLGLAGDKTIDIIQRIPLYRTKQTSTIFLMVGINDLANGIPVASVLMNYNTLVNQMHQYWPTAKIHLLSVLPVEYESFTHTAIYPQNVEKLNEGIAALATETKAFYIDMTRAFSNGNGNLNPMYTYDGLHLNNAGYLVWKKEIETYLQN
ncbi:MAG: GDSL-type esterase/lipase family protein [Salinivirgaceae bacterium]